MKARRGWEPIGGTMRNAAPPLLEVTDLRKYFRVGGRGPFGGGTSLLKAVDGISFSIDRGGGHYVACHNVD